MNEYLITVRYKVNAPDVAQAMEIFLAGEGEVLDTNVTLTSTGNSGYWNPEDKEHPQK